MASNRFASVLAVALLCVALAALAHGRPVTRKGDWMAASRTAPSDLVPISIALRLRNEQWLQETFEAVSNPRSPRWRQYVTKEEIRAQTAPARETVAAVLELLNAEGLVSFELVPAGDFMKVLLPASSIERLFSVELYNFDHVHTEGLSIVRAI